MDAINQRPAGMPWLPRWRRSTLYGEEMFAVQEDKWPDAERSGTHVVELSDAAHEGMEPGADMDIGQGWGGIDDRGEAPLLVVVKYTQPGPWLVCLARSAFCKTDKGCCHQKMRCKPLWPCVRIEVVG